MEGARRMKNKFGLGCLSARGPRRVAPGCRSFCAVLKGRAGGAGAVSGQRDWAELCAGLQPR